MRLAARLLTAALCGCALAPSVMAVPPGEAHGAPAGRRAADAAAAAVRAEFEAVCRTLRASDETFFGTAALQRLERQLRQPPEDLEREAPLRWQQGRELIELGRPEEAVPILEKILDSLRAAAPDSELIERVVATLALAHLQAAEDENCLLHHTAASCLLPITRDGIHRRPGHARQAAERYLEHLELQPLNLISAWLLNLARMLSGDYPEGVPAEFRLPAGALEPVLGSALRPGSPFPAWRERGAELGVNPVDLAGGAVMDDFDGDGLLDLVTSTSDHCGSLKAFRNDGHGGFENVTVRWGLDAQLGGLNLVHADYDNDGRLDLLVLRGAWLGDYGRIRNSLLRNELGGPAGGRFGGRFVDVTRAAGLAEPALPTQTAAWADYDGDGDLDLYVGNETLPEDDFPSQLFRNNGAGADGIVTFSDVTRPAGVANRRYAKAVTWGDYDDDGDPDLYVSNIGPNRLYRNNGAGADGIVTFSDVAVELAVTRPELRSFTSWFFDYDNDGDLDLFVADYQAKLDKVIAAIYGIDTRGGNSLLYRNDGGRFVEVSERLGLGRPTLPMGANYGDLDNDGWLDIYLGTGDPEFESLVPNVMFRNRGGAVFEDVSAAGRFGHLQKGHGVAFGDLDNDGDQDLLHQLGGFYPGDAYGNALFENPGNDHRWIVLRLEGREANRFGVGARIEVRTAADGVMRSIHVVAGSGGSFGGSSMQQEIGLGTAREIVEIVIRWPGSGTVQRFPRVAPDRVYRVVEGLPGLEPLEVKRIEWRTAGERAHRP